MVQKLIDIEDISIKQPFQLMMPPGATLVFQIDQEEFDISEAQKIIDCYMKAFPKNGVICLFKGVEIKGVIEHE